MSRNTLAAGCVNVIVECTVSTKWTDIFVRTRLSKASLKTHLTSQNFADEYDNDVARECVELNAIVYARTSMQP